MPNRVKSFKDFFNALDLLLFVIDSNGIIIYCNKAASERLGYHFSEIIGQPAISLHPKERQNEAQLTIDQMMKGKADSCPVPLVTKTGELIEVETKTVNGIWDGQDVLFGVSKDVTELKLSNEKFTTIFRFSPIAMAITSINDGSFLETNETWHILTGYSKKDIKSQTASSLGMYFDLSDRTVMLEKLKKEGKLSNYPVHFKRKDGSSLYGSFSANPIIIGKDLCWITAFLDQTHEREIENSLNEFREKVIKNARDSLVNLLNSAILVK